jgi:hypothetical protein
VTAAKNNVYDGQAVHLGRPAQTRLVFFLSWIALLLGGRTGLFRDPGTYWHILTGARIFHAGFPHTDWLTFTFVGRPWIAHQWLGECLMALLNRAGGFDALLVATSGALALLCGWLFHRLITGGMTAAAAGFAIAIFLLSSAHHFHVRPHILSLLAFAWMYARLVDFEAGRIDVAKLWPFIPLFWLWANSHGAVVGGLGTFALAVTGWIAAFLARRESPVASWRQIGQLAALLVVCAGVGLINPYGADLPRTWTSILGSPLLPRMIVEHASLVRTQSWQVLAMMALYAAAFIATLVGSWPSWPRITWLLPAIWAALTFARIRQAPFFAIAAILVLADLLRQAGWVARLRRRGLRLHEDSADGPGRCEPFPRGPALALLAALLATFAVHTASPRDWLVKLDREQWPIDLLPSLHALADRLPPGAALLNDMPFGGFVAFHEPRLRPMVDDRWELFGDDFMMASFRAEPGWLEDLTDRHDVRIALAEPGTPLAAYLDSARARARGWTEVAASPAAVLFRRAPLSRGR